MVRRSGRDEADREPAAEFARGGIQSIDAALPVLRALARLPGAASLSDLAQATGMSASKIHRYLASFLHAGLVIQHQGSRRYDLGPAAVEIGVAAIARNDFVSRAGDVLGDLTEETGLTALMSVWGTHGPTVVRWARAPALAASAFGLGSIMPLLTSSSGRVFLAFLPRRITAGHLKQEIEAALASGLTWPDVEISPEGIDVLCAKVRRTRIATVDGRYVPGLLSIATPITNWQGEIEAAVTLIGTTDDLVLEAHPARHQLLAFAERLSVSPPAAADMG